MKLWMYTAAGVLCLVALDGSLQAQQKTQPQVLFSRSDTQAQTQETSAKKIPPIQITDEERGAITFTAYDLNIHLTPRQSSIAVNARVTVRNDSTQPLSHLPLQLSSTLHFDQISMNGKALPFTQQTLRSDTDHTGELQEAAIALAAPLAPGQELTITVGYSGMIEQTAKRLVKIGTPDDMANNADWDRISEGFTGLRGFGDVVWYPVSSKPVLLGKGADLFTEIGRQKQRQTNATVKMRVTEEFFDEAPNVAVLDGHPIALGAPQTAPTASFPGVLTFSLPQTELGFTPLSLFVAHRVKHEGKGIAVYARTEDDGDAQGYLTAQTMVAPLLTTWLGAKARGPLTVLDLPESGDAPFETGVLLATGLTPAAPEKLASATIHGLAHAAFSSPREWLNEGVPIFMSTLWIEQGQGRTAALERLEAERTSLAVAEPASPGAADGEDLLHASDAIYYGTKAAYVLWMLRDLAGDKALAAALHNYDPAQDTRPEYFEELVEAASTKYKQATGQDLKWFFNDWVYHDRGLPDISIGSVYPSNSSQVNTFLVAIDLTNDGYAAASVPVTVRSQSASQTERVRIPARSKITYRMLIQGEPTEVQVNDGVVPEVEATIHRKSITMTNLPAR
ncbi:hypothetical protein [Acidipila rosea]|uniref:Peptidase M1 membrane alanine aminopeptidase domain-containing protein n=1 Tax=Acidipila rosea TaxID=768535 RepID=A0A4R1LAE0_9BACT|nr:hypothetical protein [Acidipila rosea]TCK75144.1 hypothetical protein C7378_0124 [Acidipila rosea]